MKKLVVILGAAVLLTACSANKNLLSEKMSKYPSDKYITKVTNSREKQDAKDSALKELKAIFDNLPQYKNSEVRRESIISQAYAAQWWKDKETGKYYAIAVLEREPAQGILKPYYSPIDGQLVNMQNKIAQEKDKFVRLKYAVAMPDLLKQRAEIDSEYSLLTFDGSAFDEEQLYSFKSTLNKTFYDIKINSVITGVDDSTVKTYIIDALNSLGFAVGEDMPVCDIELKLKTAVDKYPSKTTDGLYWSTATANVALKDMETKGIFATFSESERIGSSREEESQRRSLIAVGEKCAPSVKQKLIEYVEKK